MKPHFEAQTGRLSIGNLGTNGQDGVAVAIGQAHSWKAVLTNLNASILPTGAYLVADTYGMLHGASLEQRICSTRIEDAGSVGQVSFDFSSLGAYLHRRGETQTACR